MLDKEHDAQDNDQGKQDECQDPEKPYHDDAPPQPPDPGEIDNPGRGGG